MSTGSAAGLRVPVPASRPASEPTPSPIEPALSRALLGPRSALWMAVGVLLLRAPGFNSAILNIDEADHVVIARTMHAGALPYVGVVETKPPLTYVAFWLAGLAGDSVLPARLLAAAFLLGTALLVRAAVRRWTGDDRAVAAAGWCTIIATLCEPPWAATEILMNLPVAAALWLWARAERERRLDLDLAVGVAAGIATLFKHQAGIVAPALLLGATLADLSPRGLARTLGRGALVAVGVALPWLATLAVYAQVGHARDLVEWVLTRNFGYIQAAGALGWSQLGGFALGVGSLGILWWLAGAEVVRRRRDPVGLAFASALALTWVAVSAGRRYYVHYFLQFAPALGVLAGPALARLASGWTQLSAARRWTAGAWLALPVACSVAYGAGRLAFGDFPAQDRKANAVADCIRSLTRPDERVFVWGHFSPLYYRSERLPGTRYLMTSVHMGNFDPSELPPGFDPAAHRSDGDVRATIADLEERQPALVVDTAPADIHDWSRIPLAAFPDLRDEVLHRYVDVGTCAGARFYRRADLPSPALTRAPGSGSAGAGPGQ